MPTAREVLGELLYPLRASAPLLAIVVFAFFFSLVLVAMRLSSILGLAAALTVGLALLPAIMRFLLQHLDARALGRETEPLEARYFSWMENLWGVFPVVIFGALGFLLVRLQENAWAQSGVIAVAVAVLPASMIVLTMTHSPLQSLNPAALGRLIVRIRATYWIAPLGFVLMIGLVVLAGRVSFWFGGIAALYALLALFGLFGVLIRPLDVADETEIQAVEIEAPKVSEAQRLGALNLAYSFMSRGGIDNGIAHIEQSIREEGADLDAWRWYFERMTRWENPLFALRFAQRAVHELLAADEQIAASKLILRCRMIDETFRPGRDDLDAAQAALRATGNTEVADALRR